MTFLLCVTVEKIFSQVQSVTVVASIAGLSRLAVFGDSMSSEIFRISES